jgi:chromosome segregation ATPase
MTELVDEPNSGQGRKSSSAGSKIFRFLVRFLLVLILGVAIGAGAYYGLPALYRDLVQPVQTSAEQVSELEEAVSQLRRNLREQNAESADSLAEIEGEISQLREAVSEMEVQVESLNSSADALRERLEEVRPVSRQLEELSRVEERLSARLESLEAVVSAQAEEAPSPDEIVVQFQLLRSMELISRARLWLMQGNLGKAGDDIEVARDVLFRLADAGQEEDTFILSIAERLDRALEELEERPVIAADDLDIAWQLLILATEPTP